MILVNKILNDEAVRKNVVFTIAKNMHFNTDIAAMNTSMPSELMNALKTYFSSNSKASQFSICGVPEFTFAKDDFFETDDVGNITGSKAVSLMAWMLKTGKLMTNTETPLLIDPFVYGEGINKSGAKVVIDNLRSRQTPESKDAPSPSAVQAAITQEQKK